MSYNLDYYKDYEEKIQEQFKYNKERLDLTIKKCYENNESELIIEGEFIDTIPECIKDFVHLKILCIRNTSIKELINIPKNLTSLLTQENNFIIVDGLQLPDSIRELVLTENNTSKIINLKEGITELTISKNNLESIIVPSTVEVLDISDNTLLLELPVLSNNIRALSIENTMITNIETIPDTVEELNTCRCNLYKVKKLPQNLTNWKSWSSNIKHISEFPKNIQIVDLYNNSLSEIPILPDSLTAIDLSHNELIKIPNIPKNLNEIILKHNDSLNIVLIKELEKNYPKITISYDEQNDFYKEFFQKIDLKNDSKIDYFRYNNDNPHYIPLDKMYII